MTGPLKPRPMPAVAIEDGEGRTVALRVWDEWSEDVLTFEGAAAAPFRLRGDHRPDRRGGATRSHLVGEALAPVVVATKRRDEDPAPVWARGDHLALPALAEAPFLQLGVWHHRPDIAASLVGASPSIRAAVVSALIGGVIDDHGVIRARIDRFEVSADPETGEWEVASDGGVCRGSSLRGFAGALGAVGDGVFAVRLIEAVFGWRLPVALARSIAEAIDATPKPREVSP